MSPFKAAIKRYIFGDTLLPRDFTIGLAEPQDEITLWLQGGSAPLDVTSSCAVACASPFTVCIAIDDGPALTGPAALQFRQRSGDQCVLGELGLTHAAVTAAPGLCFFSVRSAAVKCLPKHQMWAHRLLRYRHSRSAMSRLDLRANTVNFIRPHPVVVVSLMNDAGGTVFPMNFTGDLGPGRFGLALQSANQPAGLVEAARRIAVSSVPPAHGSLAYQLGVHHFRKSIDWSHLPFATRPSATWRIPVPQFALRVREMEIEQVYKLGRHTFFVARIVADERLSNAPVLHTIHGHYQAWRLRGRPAELDASLLADASHKGDSSSTV